MKLRTRALGIVRKFFPNVTSVTDATKPVTIEVTKRDAASEGKKDHKACAMAVACKRKLHLDGVVISRSVAYLVKDAVATRYGVPEQVAREVVAFDRGGAFEPGEYRLDKPTRIKLLGAAKDADGRPEHSKTKAGRGEPHHMTTNIRTALGAMK